MTQLIMISNLKEKDIVGYLPLDLSSHCLDYLDYREVARKSSVSKKWDQAVKYYYDHNPNIGFWSRMFNMPRTEVLKKVGVSDLTEAASKLAYDMRGLTLGQRMQCQIFKVLKGSSSVMQDQCHTLNLGSQLQQNDIETMVRSYVIEKPIRTEQSLNEYFSDFNNLKESFLKLNPNFSETVISFKELTDLLNRTNPMDVESVKIKLSSNKQIQLLSQLANNGTDSFSISHNDLSNLKKICSHNLAAIFVNHGGLSDMYNTLIRKYDDRQRNLFDVAQIQAFSNAQIQALEQFVAQARMQLLAPHQPPLLSPATRIFNRLNEMIGFKGTYILLMLVAQAVFYSSWHLLSEVIDLPVLTNVDNVVYANLLACILTLLFM